MNNQMIMLASYFLHSIKGFPKDANGKIECEAQYKKEVMNDIGEILAGGSVTAAQMHDIFKREEANPNRSLFYKPCHILDAYKITYKRKSYRDPDNLLIPGQFYYHHRLQVTPPPPMIQVFDDGTFSSSYENDGPFYLEIVDKLTKKDLVDYFYNKTNMKCQEATLARDIGAFEHMLRFWDADFILYLIDEAFACAMDEGKQLPKTPLDIQHYEAQAAAVYEARKILCFEEGIDRVIPRSSN